MNIADMAILTFHAESALLRVIKMNNGGDSIQANMMRVYLTDAVDAVNKAGKDAINAFAEGDEQRMMLLGLKRLTKMQPFNTKKARRLIADALIEAGKYSY